MDESISSSARRSTSSTPKPYSPLSSSGQTPGSLQGRSQGSSSRGKTASANRPHPSSLTRSPSTSQEGAGAGGAGLVRFDRRSSTGSSSSSLTGPSAARSSLTPHGPATGSSDVSSPSPFRHIAFKSKLGGSLAVSSSSEPTRSLTSPFAGSPRSTFRPHEPAHTGKSGQKPAGARRSLEPIPPPSAEAMEEGTEAEPAVAVTQDGEEEEEELTPESITASLDWDLVAQSMRSGQDYIDRLVSTCVPVVPAHGQEVDPHTSAALTTLKQAAQGELLQGLASITSEHDNSPRDLEELKQDVFADLTSIQSQGGLDLGQVARSLWEAMPEMGRRLGQRWLHMETQLISMVKVRLTQELQALKGRLEGVTAEGQRLEAQGKEARERLALARREVRQRRAQQEVAAAR